MLRLDKMVLAALEATLRLATDPERGVASIPLWSMAAATVEELMNRAEVLARALCERAGYRAAVVRADSFLGGGSAPIQPIPTAAIAISAPFPWPHRSEAGLAAALRRGEPPVVVRVQKGEVLLDMRTIPAESEADLLDALVKVCHDREGPGGVNGPAEDVLERPSEAGAAL